MYGVPLGVKRAGLGQGGGMQIRNHVYYSGTVQGVGFRYTARRLAAGRDVTGFVRNLPDGRVELIAEGEGEAVGRFFEDVAAAFEGLVRDVEVRDEAPTGEFRGFGVSFEGW
jgi:acylphosphatase